MTDQTEAQTATEEDEIISAAWILRDPANLLTAIHTVAHVSREMNKALKQLAIQAARDQQGSALFAKMLQDAGIPATAYSPGLSLAGLAGQADALMSVVTLLHGQLHALNDQRDAALSLFMHLTTNSAGN